MPQAATHILIALVIGSLIRDYVVKDKKKFPLHYVLILGLASLLPDFDVALYWILHWFGFGFSEIHRTFTHSLIIPSIFLILSGLTWKYKSRELGKRHLKIHTIFLVIALGIFIHFVLDFLLAGSIMPLYPFSYVSIGENLVNFLPFPLNEIFFPSLDAALIVLWLVYIEYKHRISDFI